MKKQNSIKHDDQNEESKGTSSKDTNKNRDRSASVGTSSTSSSDSHSSGGNVIVVCRFRPLNQNELNHGGTNVCADFHPNK